MSVGFAAGEGQWRARLGTLRQVVRDEVVARQLAGCLPDLLPRRVLDIGCGQGTQALRLARRGHIVAGLDSSAQLLDDFRAALVAEPAEVSDRVRLVVLPGPGSLLDAIAQIVVPGGIVSLLVRNGDALAMRPGLLGDWDGVGRAFDGAAYLNRIGVVARADRLEDLKAALLQRRMPVARWSGIRVFTDTATSDVPVPDDATLDAILRFEAAHTPSRQQ